MLARQLDNAPAAKDIVKHAKILTMDLIAAGIRSDRCPDLTDALNAWGRSETKWPTASDIIGLLRRNKSLLKFLPAPQFDYNCRSEETSRMVSEAIRKRKK